MLYEHSFTPLLHAPGNDGSKTCGHPFTARARMATEGNCIVCLDARVRFEHLRWLECAQGYSVERQRRQELEKELARVRDSLTNLGLEVARLRGVLDNAPRAASAPLPPTTEAPRPAEELQSPAVPLVQPAQ